MRLAVLALVAVALPAAAAIDAVPRPSARPLRVMSISACTDQLVLALLPPGRITSVTWLARDPAISLLARQAAAVGVNHGQSEEVLRDRPDLVVAGSFTGTATRALLKRLGWPLIEVGPADTIDQIRATTRQVARAVGEGARGEALLARMDRRLADLARDPGPRLRVAAWDGGGFGAGPGSLFDTVLTAAGADNVADPAGFRRAVPDTELLLAAAPALLVGGAAYDRDDLRANVARHPLVRRLWGKGRSVTIGQSAYLCGTPFVADAALDLRRQLHGAAATAQRPLPFVPRPR